MAELDFEKAAWGGSGGQPGLDSTPMLPLTQQPFLALSRSLTPESVFLSVKQE